MSMRYSLALPDLDEQPVLHHAQKAVINHIQRSESEYQKTMRRWYADQARARVRTAAKGKSPKRHRPIKQTKDRFFERLVKLDGVNYL